MSKEQLNEKLKRHDYHNGVDAFEDSLLQVFQKVAPNRTVDNLLCHPTQALVYCEMVRMKIECPRMPENIICTTLLNMRKRS